MNRIYKVIWSKVKHQYVVVSELAHRDGKQSKSEKTAVHGSLRALAAALMVSGAIMITPYTAFAAEVPENAQGNTGTYEETAPTFDENSKNNVSNGEGNTFEYANKNTVEGDENILKGESGNTTDNNTITGNSNELTTSKGNSIVGGDAMITFNNQTLGGNKLTSSDNNNITGYNNILDDSEGNTIVGGNAGFTGRGSNRNVVAGNTLKSSSDNNIEGDNNKLTLSNNNTVVSGTVEFDGLYAVNDKEAKNIGNELRNADNNTVTGDHNTIHEGENNVITGDSNEVGTFGTIPGDVYSNNNVIEGSENIIREGSDNIIKGNGNQSSVASGNTIIGNKNGMQTASTNNKIVGDSNILTNASNNIIVGNDNKLKQGTSSSPSDNNRIWGDGNELQRTSNTWILGSENKMGESLEDGKNNLIFGSSNIFGKGPSSNSIVTDSLVFGNNNKTGYGLIDSMLIGSNMELGNLTPGNNGHDLTNAIAVGQNIKALSGDNAILIGNNITANNTNTENSTDAESASQAVVVATDTKMVSDRATMLGYGTAADEGSVSIGLNASAMGDNSVSIGPESRTTEWNSVAIGYDSETGEGSGYAIALGRSTAVAKDSQSAIAIGSYAYVGEGATSSIAIGANGRWGGSEGNPGATWSEDHSGVGDGSYQSIAMGSAAVVDKNAQNSIAIGGLDTMSGKYNPGDNIETVNVGTGSINATVVGVDSFVGKNSTFGTVYGSKAKVGEGVDYATAVGSEAFVSGTKGLAAGYNAQATAESAVATGDSAQATGNSAIATGDNAQATADYAIATGNAAQATATSAIATGNSAQATAENSVAVGANSAASLANSVALGAGSVVTENENFTTQKLNEFKTQLGDDYNDAWNIKDADSNGVISVGSSDGGERRIINVARGRISADSTDAINGSQLRDYAVMSATPNEEDGSVTLTMHDRYGIGDDYTVSVPNTSKWNLKVDNISTPVNYNDTVVFRTEKNDKDATNLYVKKDGLTVTVGMEDEITLTGVTADRVSVGDVSINKDTGIDAGGFNITNVKDGEISSTSQEAVNGSQLYKVQQAHTTMTVNNEETPAPAIPEGAVSGGYTDGNLQLKQSQGENGQIQYNVKLNDNVVLGNDKITLNGAPNGNDPLVNIDNKFMIDQQGNVQATVSSGFGGMRQTTLDFDNTGLKVTQSNNANNSESSTLINGGNVTIIGEDKTRTNINGSMITAGDVKINGEEKKNTMTGLANMTWSTDEEWQQNNIVENRAATEGQLQDLTGDFNDFAVKYDKNDDGTVNHNKITLEGDGGTTITNVAKGDISKDSTDAVNGSQLWDVQQEAGKHTTMTVNNEEMQAPSGENEGNYTDGNLQLKQTVTDGQIQYNVKLNDDITLSDGVEGGNNVQLSGTNGTISAHNSRLTFEGTGNYDNINDMSFDENGLTITNTKNLRDGMDKDTILNSTTSSTTIRGKEITAGNVKVNAEEDKDTVTGLSNTTWKIDEDWQKDNVVADRAATEGQLQDLTGELQSVSQEAAKHTTMTVNGGTAAPAVPEGATESDYTGGNLQLKQTVTDGQIQYDVKLNDNIILGSTDGSGSSVNIDGTDGSIILNSVTENGSNSVEINAERGTITGLKDAISDGEDWKAFTEHGEEYTDGSRAATENDLYQVYRHGVQYDVDENGNPNYNSITLQGTPYSYNAENHVASGGTSITNVAYATGNDGSEAVNVDYLKDQIDAAKTEVTGADKHIDYSKDYTVNKETHDVTLDVVDGQGKKVGDTTIKDVAAASDLGDVTNINEDLKNEDGSHTTVVDAVNNLDDKVGSGDFTGSTHITNPGDTTITDAIKDLDSAITNTATEAGKHTTVSRGDNNINIDTSTNANGGTDYKVSLNPDLNVNTVTATGNVSAGSFTSGSISINSGNSGTIGGLTNKTWNFDHDYSDSGQAATEAQLHAVSEGSVQYDRKEDGSVNKGSITLGGEGGTTIHNVKPGTEATDAATVGQVAQVASDSSQAINNMGNQINRLGDRIDKVGAGAAALAALHPLDFDPDDKLSFAAGYGNYAGENAVAIGAFYQPNEDTLFSVGGTVGNDENMVNVGVSFKLGQKNHVSNSRVAMAKEVISLRDEVAQLKALMAHSGILPANGQIDTSALFPDVPENHWAYEYVHELAKLGIVEGYPDGNFDGDRMMTRYEFAAIVYRAMQKGVNVDRRMLSEFEPELKLIRVDVVAKDRDGNPTIERVRVNEPEQQQA